MSCGVGRRGSSDLALLWLWYRPVATALIPPLAWEPPYTTEVALKMAKETKKRKRKQEGKCYHGNSGSSSLQNFSGRGFHMGPGDLVLSSFGLTLKLPPDPASCHVLWVFVQADPSLEDLPPQSCHRLTWTTESSPGTINTSSQATSP